MPLLVFDDIYHVVGDKLADELIRDIDLDIKCSLIVKTFPLDHFSVMDSDGQEDGIHNLTEDKLEVLVLEHCDVEAQND